jgi:hypothetical protein
MAMANEQHLKPMRILDYEAAGRKVVQWAQKPETRPSTMEEFRHQLKGLVDIPERYTDLQICQGDDNLFILRLPPARQVSESEETVKKDWTENPGLDAYSPPQFYMDMLSGEKEFDNVEFFYSRIADYTIRGCK